MNPGVIDSGVKIVTNGLLLWVDAAQKRSYPTSGTTWTDLSGNGNNGTLTNGPTFNSDNGGSIVFDGSNDYVNTAVQRNATMTLECFFRCNANGFRPIFGSGGNGVDRVQIGRDRDYPTGFLVFFGPSQYNSFADGGYFVWDNNWHHMSFSANNGTGSLYTDGLLRNTTNYGATSRTDSIIIGAQLQDDYYFQGRISNVRIYNRALSATEILQNYNAEKSRFGL